MTKQDRKKPVFHEAVAAPKDEFVPHQVGGVEENEAVADELELPPEQNEDLDVLLGETDDVVEAPSVEEPAPELPPESTPDILKNGWRVISREQQTGKTYIVSNTLEESGGEMAFWRKTRALSHFKWVLHGRWSYSLTNKDLIPQPIYWKAVN